MSDGLRICLISIHGLIRGDDLELGRDADTGGQTKYVVEVARALGQRADVARVDLVTRRVVDPAVSADYAQAEEQIGDHAWILRFDAGPDEYIRKENLWDHLDSFSDHVVSHMIENGVPDIIHSHYADAGYVGARLSKFFGIPQVHTGHSLGRVKRMRLLASGVDRDQVEEKYNMARRVEAEEETLATAELVIVSTQQEIDEQYELYDCYQPDSMAVVPPGTDLERFFPPDGTEGTSAIAGVLDRFLAKPEKPIILALSRPDERKNIITLVEAFGESPELQDLSNLVVVAGNRDDISTMDSGLQDVLTDILLAIDRYDLYGKISYPKRHAPEEVPVIYRLTTARKGVFVNPALTEPFGLTLIEAAASGAPIVATEDGGPRDIIANCQNGDLVDPLDKDAITQSIAKYLVDPAIWEQASMNGLKGVREHYSWEAHAENYVGRIKGLVGLGKRPPRIPAEHRPHYRDRAFFTDIDQSLLGDPEALKTLSRRLHERTRDALFGIATGRQLDAALRAIRHNNLPMPDVLITAGGSEIHYHPSMARDEHWERHIDHNWTPRAVRRVLSELPGIERQPAEMQSRYKISYNINPEVAPSQEEIQSLIYQAELNVNLIHSFGQYLDILPHRASKGLALRYCAHHLGIPLDRVLVAGGSGADADMVRGNTLSVVVANRHNEELSMLDQVEDRIYFASKSHGAGILEAMEHYDFFGECREPAPATE